MPEQTSKESFEAKLKEMQEQSRAENKARFEQLQEQEKANRLAIERYNQLTPEQQRVELKARFEGYLKQAQAILNGNPKGGAPVLERERPYDNTIDDEYVSEYMKEYYNPPKQRGMER